MKIKDVWLYTVIRDDLHAVCVEDQNKNNVFLIYWGRISERTKPQAIAIAKRLCERFNDGQEGK